MNLFAHVEIYVGADGQILETNGQIATLAKKKRLDALTPSLQWPLRSFCFHDYVVL